MQSLNPSSTTITLPALTSNQGVLTVVMKTLRNIQESREFVLAWKAEAVLSWDTKSSTYIAVNTKETEERKWCWDQMRDSQSIRGTKGKSRSLWTYRSIGVWASIGHGQIHWTFICRSQHSSRVRNILFKSVDIKQHDSIILCAYVSNWNFRLQTLLRKCFHLCWSMVVWKKHEMPRPKMLSDHFHSRNSRSLTSTSIAHGEVSSLYPNNKRIVIGWDL